MFKSLALVFPTSTPWQQLVQLDWPNVETPGNLKTSISNDKCAKGNNKENEKNSKVSCKGGKLYKAQEKLARGAGVNVGEYLCISHRDEVMRANNRCSFPSRNSTQHSRALVPIPRHLYKQIDKIGAGVQDYQPGCKWCTKCKKMERKLDWYFDSNENCTVAKTRLVSVTTEGFLITFKFFRHLGFACVPSPMPNSLRLNKNKRFTYGW